MALAKSLLLGSVLLLTGGVLYGMGCSSSSNAPPGDDGGGSDSFTHPDTQGQPDTAMHDVATDTTQEGGGDGGMACDPTRAFTPLPWVTPTPFGQGACTTAQINAYLACSTTMAGCAAFRADAANMTCLGCIETDEGATAHGPIVTSMQGGMLAVVEVNFGGCEANFDGSKSSTGCGAKLNQFNECALAECSDCPDFGPMPGTQSQGCLTAAFAQGGACNMYKSTLACLAEITDGGAASPCLDTKNFLPIWCGSAPDAGDGGGD